MRGSPVPSHSAHGCKSYYLTAYHMGKTSKSRQEGAAGPGSSGPSFHSRPQDSSCYIAVDAGKLPDAESYCSLTQRPGALRNDNILSKMTLPQASGSSTGASWFLASRGLSQLHFALTCIHLSNSDPGNNSVSTNVGIGAQVKEPGGLVDW